MFETIEYDKYKLQFANGAIFLAMKSTLYVQRFNVKCSSHYCQCENSPILSCHILYLKLKT